MVQQFAKCLLVGHEPHYARILATLVSQLQCNKMKIPPQVYIYILLLYTFVGVVMQQK